MRTKELLDIPAGDVRLEGDLSIPDHAAGVVIFAHGAGSSRQSPRNNYVAERLQRNGLGTLLFDLLTELEDMVYANRFDIDLIARRMADATVWLKNNTAAQELPIGFFGASTGSAAALRASVAIARDVTVRAIVSRGGRPDLVGEVLPLVSAPTLLIVGSEDRVVIDLNRYAYERLTAEKTFEIIPDAGHLFEEPGALETVADIAIRWFREHLV